MKFDGLLQNENSEFSNQGFKQWIELQSAMKKNFSRPKHILEVLEDHNRVGSS